MALEVDAEFAAVSDSNAQRSDEPAGCARCGSSQAVSPVAGDWPSVAEDHNSAGDRSMNM